MDSIDVHDLPEPVARAIAETVETLRAALRPEDDRQGEDLPVWDLGTRGTLRREDIYDFLSQSA